VLVILLVEELDLDTYNCFFKSSISALYFANSSCNLVFNAVEEFRFFVVFLPQSFLDLVITKSDIFIIEIIKIKFNFSLKDIICLSRTGH